MANGIFYGITYDRVNGIANVITNGITYGIANDIANDISKSICKDKDTVNSIDNSIVANDIDKSKSICNGLAYAKGKDIC